MFVFNCKLDLDEQLKYPKNETKKKSKKYKKKQAAEQEETAIDQDSAMMPPPEEYDEYRPVACSECNSNVGVSL